MIRIFLFCILGFLVYGCAPATVQSLKEEKGAELLTAEKVYPLVNDNTLFVHSSEEDAYLYFHKSGELFGKDIYTIKDTGKWDVSEDGELCFRMRKWWYGDLRCFSVYTAADRYYLANNSEVLAYSAEALPGDSQNLFSQKPSPKKSYRKSLREKQQHSQKTASSPPAPATAHTPGVKKNASSTAALSPTVQWMAKDCPDCNLSRTDLSKADLVQANLRNAQLEETNLSMSNLRRANLEGANLRNADLQLANLPGANLQNADLRGANLRGANLIRANLTGARVDNAVFTDALLDAVIGLSR